MPDSESPIYDQLRPAGIQVLGAIRWNCEIARKECSFPVLEQLVLDHNTGQNRWVRVPIYPDDYQGEKPPIGKP
jgi:hypothetical protein